MKDFWIHPRNVLLLSISLLGFGCKRSEPPTNAHGPDRMVIGVSLLNLSSEFVVMLDEAMERRAKEQGVALIVADAQRNPEKQIQQVDQFIGRHVSAIILNPCEVEASSPAVDNAHAAKIPIVNVNSLTRSTPDAFIGSDDEESGKIALSYLSQRLRGKGSIVMMEGYMGQAAQIKRNQGARGVLAKNPGLRLIADQTAEWDRAKAVSLMENWIQSHGKQINAVFAQNDEMALGAVLALEQAGIKTDVVVVGVDAIADARRAIKTGRMDATVFQDANAQGAAAVDAAIALARGGPAGKNLLIPFQLVTAENVDALSR